MPRPISATVHLDAIAHNVSTIKGLLTGRVCMPVVKANAYGHGLSRIYPALQQADALAILEIEGAIALRQMGWAKPIVLLEGCFDSEDIAAALDWRLDWVVHKADQLAQLTSQSLGGPLKYKPRIFLKVNTGMNRLGFTLDEAPQAVHMLDQLASKGAWPTPVLMTHFANADAANLMEVAPSPIDQHQKLMQLKPNHWASSLGNSAGVLNCTAWVGDIARPGIATYGASPGPRGAAEYGLRPAMHLQSQILAVQQVRTGQRVGYGSRWEARRNSRIAVVACGYADGYPRHAPDQTPTGVCGRIAPLAGRVSMDMLTIDITDIPEAQVGTPVELWGPNVAVDDVAHSCGTISYELLCAVAPRVPMQVKA
ncbi:alanine racemase [Limnobacter sp.]|uniref:alanine racemase n=1 Tax=Limnobacter sp. TaxID=2003368 RepID=UPI0035158F12